MTGAEFVKLLTENHGRIYSYLLRLIPCHHVAEDLMQETTATMWQQRDRFEPGSNFAAWGRRIAYYKVLDYRHQQHRDQRMVFSEDLLRLIEQTAPGPEDMEPFYLRKLRHCLARLDTEDLRLVKLRYWKHVRIREIADRLKMSLRNVYYHLARIHGLLLACMEREEA